MSANDSPDAAPAPAAGTGGDAAYVVLVTAPAAAAPGLARTLVGERLAACVSALPGVRSTYAWQGTIEESDEVLLLMKTTATRLGALERRVRELHPYEVPEVLALSVASGLEPYLDWLRRSVTPA
ncbi:MAG: divalent-cation tolerance protein CutA [Proteobacteria bacterium]|nr:divalent-cation tolerance protein CutA [Pseudomonadota bacterium]